MVFHIQLTISLILQTLNMSNCHNHSHVGLSSLINGAENLRELTLAYGPSVSLISLSTKNSWKL